MPDFQFIIHGEMRWLWNDPTLKMLTMHYLYTYNNECKIFRRFQSALRRQSTIKTPCSHPQFSWKKSDSGKSLSIFYHKYILNLTDGLNDSGMQSVWNHLIHKLDEHQSLHLVSGDLKWPFSTPKIHLNWKILSSNKNDFYSPGNSLSRLQTKKV